MIPLDTRHPTLNSTVFIIDDDAFVRKSLSRLLRSAGYTTETFASAEEFLGREHFNGIGCLLLDVQMPGLSGMDLQKELNKADYQMPIIFITGHGDIPMSVEAMKKGAVDFLTKPFDDKDLLQAVMVTAAVALVTMLLLAPLIGLMPEATLAAVVIVYSIGMIKPAEFHAILKVRGMEFFWALAAFAGVVMLGTLTGILVAIIISLVALAHQVANPPVYVLGRKPGTNIFRPRSREHPEDETFSGLLILRLEGRVFFANAERITEKIRPLVAEAKPRVVALDLSGVPDFEYTALKMLTEAEKRQRERGVMLWLVGLNPEVLRVVQHSELGETLGRERMFFNLERAVETFQGRSGSARQGEEGPARFEG